MSAAKPTTSKPGESEQLSAIAQISRQPSFRMSTALLIAAAAVLPFAVLFFELQSEHFSKTITIVTFVVCAWVIIRHRANIQRLQAGTEKRLASEGEETPR